MVKITIVSGGFDPIHPGHVRMMKNASLFEDTNDIFDRNELIVIMNNDNWLKTKKGYYFMNEEQRKEILKAIKYVDKVITTKHTPNSEDMSVCRELEIIREMYPDDELIFCNGGDRKADNIPEYQLCEKLGIRMAFNIGGDKIESSSELVGKLMEAQK
jgi:cytidyltransferase-like protein